MPTPKRKGSSVAIDTVPLPERVDPGKVTKAGNKYYLTVAGRKREIPIGPLLPEAKIRPMVGKQVAVAYSRRSPGAIVAIGTWPTPERPRFRCVLCYIAPPDIIRRVHDSVRDSVISELIKAKILSQKLGGLLRK